MPHNRLQTNQKLFHYTFGCACVCVGRPKSNTITELCAALCTNIEIIITIYTDWRAKQQKKINMRNSLSRLLACIWLMLTFEFSRKRNKTERLNKNIRQQQERKACANQTMKIRDAYCIDRERTEYTHCVARTATNYVYLTRLHIQFYIWTTHTNTHTCAPTVQCTWHCLASLCTYTHEMPFSSVILCVRSFAGCGCIAGCYVFECEACLHPYLLALLRTLWNIAYGSASGGSYTERVHTARARRAHTSHCCLMLCSVPNILYSERSKSPSSSTLKIQYKIVRAFADCTVDRTPHAAPPVHHSTHGGNRNERRCQPRDSNV